MFSAVMFSTKARVLSRLIPSAHHYALNSSASLTTQSASNSLRDIQYHGARISSLPIGGLAQTKSIAPAGLYLMPRRTLAGSTDKEDYILQQNSLTEAEKKSIDSSVAKDYEDWVPYGYCLTDKEEDIFRYKMFMVSAFTVGFVIFLYIWVHLPPRNRREWVTREAYLELERRQRLGLPLVDRNLIPADQIMLPSLDELGDDYEIII